MKRWEIWKAALEGLPEPKYFVLISPQEIIDGEKRINALVCNTRRPISEKKSYHSVLMESDGMDRTTLVPCNMVFLVSKSAFFEHKGTVGFERRLDIARNLARIFGSV